ncbi:ribose ABC superfamily ATP-binding protein [Litchfieldella qijiaojingensis]|uniref:Ribose ABC superfamily ATP-binding protein n=1 Tax=Litchfieldella qijiaojingensis TaxID=980347 RepID=A0ABQ2YID5_9GAMM|nr:substrate-binding domain-containing protein [Halomonas qijiaojingensis]GGX84688.1 ribose ABC superfamily ATP-binding protein [Halomonas qijiaojingensis]
MRKLLFILLSLYATQLHAEPLKIGVSMADLGNPFFATLADAIGDSARAAYSGEVVLQVRSSAYDLTRQVRQVDAFTEQRMDIIVLAAANSEAIGPAVRRAQQAGIVVAAVDINAHGADVSVTTDNVQAGEVACRYMAERLGYVGRVAIINGAPVSSVTDRVAGCRSVLNDYPRIQLLSDDYNGGGTHSGGLEAMTYLVRSYPDLDAVFAINDPSAMGAADAARMAGWTNLFIVSVDGSPEGVEALKETPSLLVASAAQLPRRMAETAIRESLRHLAEARPQESQVIRLPTHLVTRENAEHFGHWGDSLPTP